MAICVLMILIFISKISDAEDRPGDKLVALSDGTTYMPDDNENFIMIGKDCGFFEEQNWSRLPPSNTLPRPVYFEEVRHKYPGTVIFLSRWILYYYR